MKKEELFNIIGEVDEQKVTAAGMAMKYKEDVPPRLDEVGCYGCLSVPCGCGCIGRSDFD